MPRGFFQLQKTGPNWFLVANKDVFKFSFKSASTFFARREQSALVRAVVVVEVVAQLTEQTLLTPEVCSSNPNIVKVLIRLYANCVL